MLWGIIYDWKNIQLPVCLTQSYFLSPVSLGFVHESLWPSVYVPVSLCTIYWSYHLHCTHVSAIMCRLQAAYHAAKPQVFSQQLQQLDLEDDKVSTYNFFSITVTFQYMHYIWLSAKRCANGGSDFWLSIKSISNTLSCCCFVCAFITGQYHSGNNMSSKSGAAGELFFFKVKSAVCWTLCIATNYA